MSGTLRFEILGPQRAWYADREIDLGPGKQRAVLAVLLLSTGRPVSTGQIVEAVWPEDPPANGPNVVQKYVAGLRRVLEPDRSPRTPGQVLSLTDAGYLLRVGPEALDAVRFERGIHRARQRRAEGRAVEALTELATALDLWQGEPFTGFTGSVFEAARQRLVELRAVALETRAELTLDLGRHREMVGELLELVAEFPVRERLRHHLMLSLYRSGRQAEALAAYREIADLLRDEHGIEPGDALQELHRRILRSDPTLASQPIGTGHPAGDQPTAPPAAVPSAPPQRASQPAMPSPAPPVAGDATVWTSPPPLSPPPLSPPAPMARPATPPAWVSGLGTVLGAAVVLLSFGVLAWLVMLFYAIRRRSRWLGLATVGYLAAVVFFVVALDSSDPDAPPTALDGFGIVSLFSAWIGGIGHVILLNRKIGALLRGQPGGPGARAVEEQRVRREHARYLIYHYPAARAELRIGRPDLPRSYDDGGLVDVNAVTDQVIATLPGLSPEQSRHVATDRLLRGPFASMEDLAARCLLPPTSTEQLRDILVFLPPIPAPTPPDQR